MATGDTLFLLKPPSGDPPASSAAGLVFVADASTPNASIPCWTFPTGTDAWMYWFYTMPDHYDGGGLTFSWKGGTDNSSTNAHILEFRCVVVADGTALTGDLGIDAATPVQISDTPPATPTDKLNYSTTGNLTHANAGSPTGGSSLVCIAAYRDHADAGDTNTGTMQVAEILVEET